MNIARAVRVQGITLTQRREIIAVVISQQLRGLCQMALSVFVT